MVTMVKKTLELDPSFTYFLYWTPPHDPRKKERKNAGIPNYKYFPIVTWPL